MTEQTTAFAIHQFFWEEHEVVAICLTREAAEREKERLEAVEQAKKTRFKYGTEIIEAPIIR